MRVVTRTRAAATSCGVLLVAATGGPGLVERGAYPATTLGACGNCHTPRDAAGKPMENMASAGGFEFEDGPIGHVVVRYIAPDPRDRHRQMDGRANRHSIAQRQAAGRDSDRAADAIRFYRQLSDGDATAIAAYLRSVKPASHEVGRTQSKNPSPPS